MMKKTTRSLREFYDLFTSGLSVEEIQRLFDVEMRGTYDFFVRSMKPVPQDQNPVKRFLVFCWNLFVVFLLKLTPARRLLYAVGFILFLFFLNNRELSYAIYSFLIFNLLLALELADKLITKDELSVAREIQLSLLPNKPEVASGYEIAPHSEVARSVGGDYYDFIPLDDRSTLVVIADVSGKGISAALYMVKVQTALRLFARQSSDLRELLIRLNEHLHGRMKRNYFLTISLLQLHPDGKINFSRAGHPPAIYYDRRRNEFSNLQPLGAAIGMKPSSSSVDVGALDSQNSIGLNQNGPVYFDQIIENASLQIHSGDLLFLYTDGVVESVDRLENEFGQARLIQILSHNVNNSAETIRDAVVSELKAFRSGAELRDDTTCIVVKRWP